MVSPAKGQNIDTTFLHSQRIVIYNINKLFCMNI